MARKATQKLNKNHTVAKFEKKSLKHRGHRPLDIIKESVSKNIPIENIEEMPSAGKFSCAKCDLYFKDEHTLTRHNRTKAHKKRLKEWEQKCHDTKDAEQAVGLY